MDILPLGSIVVLKGMSQKGIIVGRYVVLDNDEQKDYLAYPWPHGLSTDGNDGEIIQLGFNHEDIAIVVHKGYTDAEDNDYLAAVAKVMTDNTGN